MSVEECFGEFSKDNAVMVGVFDMIGDCPDFDKGVIFPLFDDDDRLFFKVSGRRNLSCSTLFNEVEDEDVEDEDTDADADDGDTIGI